MKKNITDDEDYRLLELEEKLIQIKEDWNINAILNYIK